MQTSWDGIARRLGSGCRRTSQAYTPKRKPTAGKLDAYKDYRHHMAEGCLNARVILDEIREKGYTGSSTILRIFMQPLKVENGVGYVRKNFWPRVRTFTGLQDLNRQVRHWLDTVANQRLHGTTFRVPAEMRKEETLNPVTAIAFAHAERHQRKGSNDGYVSFDANRYTVPFPYVGSIVEVQDEKNGTLRFYAGGQLIAEHPKSMGRHQIVSNKKHFEGIRSISSHPVREPTYASLCRTNPARSVGTLAFGL